MPIDLGIPVADVAREIWRKWWRIMPKCWTRRPRLRRAADGLKQQFDAIGESAIDRHGESLAIKEAARVLDNLGDRKVCYPYPPRDAGPNVWRPFLAQFIAVARSGDVEGAQAIADDTVVSSGQRLGSVVQDRRRVLVRVYAEQENEKIRLSVDNRPHPQNLQWTEGGKGFRTIAKGMLGVAQLCDVRFSGGGYPTFDLRYLTPGSDWISHHLQMDESGQVYRGIARVRVIVESLQFGTKVHELTFDATWYDQVYDRDQLVESMLELYENGSQERLLWAQAYIRGFWS